MEPLFTYLWQSAVVLTLLFIPFQLLLRKEQFYALNRAILLAIMLLSLLLPLSHHNMPAFIEGWLHQPVEQEFTPVLELGEALSTDDLIVLKQDANVAVPSWFELHWLELLIGLWSLGAMVFIGWQTRGLCQLYRMLHDRDNIRESLADGNTLLLSSVPTPSFSWMHQIVISVDDYVENGDPILIHERAHIAHHHSLDRLLLLVVQTLQWWNPFVWLMVDALTQVHEYQADLAVLRHGINATQYQLLLIRKAAGPAGFALVNGFKRNKLKLRIVMMNNMIKLRGAKSRYLALLPMMLLAVAFTARAEATTSDKQHAAVGPESSATTENDARLILSINQKGQILVNSDYVTLENLSAFLAEKQLSEDAIVEIVADWHVQMEVISKVKEILRKSHVRKVVYRMSDSAESVEQWFQAERVEPKQTDAEPAAPGNEVFEVCEEQPQYPGGDAELMKFIIGSLRYPKECAEKNIEGRVVISFIVEKDGTISNIEEKSSPHPLLTAEAKRVVAAMPKWKPGKQRGHLVRVRYVLPVSFRLDGQAQGSDKEKEAARTNPISNGPYSADMLYIYDGNVVEFEAIKDLSPTEIAIRNIQVLKSGEIYEEYLQKYPKARNGVVIMNSYSRKDQLWVVDGVPMTGEEMEAKYADGIPVQFHQLRKDAETLAKYSQYPAAKNGVNIVITNPKQ